MSVQSTATSPTYGADELVARFRRTSGNRAGLIARSNVLSRVNVEATRDSILASASFSNAPKISAFLRLVINAELNGRADAVTPYAIAVDALGQPEGFDSNRSAIVRVTAVRVRRALAEYYLAEGINNPILVEIPIGHYVPTFHIRIAPDAMPQEQSRPIAPAVDQMARRVIRRVRQIVVMIFF